MRGVHRHGPGYRGSLTVLTKTYATEQEAFEALADLKARIKRLTDEPVREPEAPAAQAQVCRQCWAVIGK